MLIDIVALGVSITALGVSIVTFYIGHTRAKKSEEIRMSREIWDRIDAQEKIIEKWTVADRNTENNMKMINAMDSLTNEIDYFVYLVENGEINDSVVREYYRKRLLPIFMTAKFIDKQNPESKDYSGTQKILELIKKYHKVTGKMEDYKKEFI
jgi:hypothetical protein